MGAAACMGDVTVFSGGRGFGSGRGVAFCGGCGTFGAGFATTGTTGSVNAVRVIVSGFSGRTGIDVRPFIANIPTNAKANAAASVLPADTRSR